jgi:hypothetical protein
MPNVTMNEGILPHTLMTPLINPQTAPDNKQNGTAIQSGHSYRTINTPKTAEPSASTLPTDKSMPPMINTKVMPTAITVKSGMRLAIVLIVRAVKKLLLNMLKIATKIASTPAIPAY